MYLPLCNLTGLDWKKWSRESSTTHFIVFSSVQLNLLRLVQLCWLSCWLSYLGCHMKLNLIKLFVISVWRFVFNLLTVLLAQRMSHSEKTSNGCAQRITMCIKTRLCIIQLQWPNFKCNQAREQKVFDISFSLVWLSIINTQLVTAILYHWFAWCILNAFSAPLPPNVLCLWMICSSYVYVYICVCISHFTSSVAIWNPCSPCSF